MNSYQKEMMSHYDKENGFEGWYFRISDKNISLAIILGISRTNERRIAFIQTLDTITHSSQFILFDADDFIYHNDPFSIQLKENYFSETEIKLDLKYAEIPLIVHVHFFEYTRLQSSLYAPTIMGPFAYLKGMECSHAIISLRHHVKGTINLHDQLYEVNGSGYIEKDRGNSFPQNYVWFQSNDCVEQEATLFFASALIPISNFKFQGTIASLHLHDKQYHFATYYGAKVKSFKQGNAYYIILNQYPYRVYIKIIQGCVCPLKAPDLGSMKVRVDESLEANISLHLYKHNKEVIKLHFQKCGCELFRFFD